MSRQGIRQVQAHVPGRLPQPLAERWSLESMPQIHLKLISVVIAILAAEATHADSPAAEPQVGGKPKDDQHLPGSTTRTREPKDGSRREPAKGGSKKPPTAESVGSSRCTKPLSISSCSTVRVPQMSALPIMPIYGRGPNSLETPLQWPLGPCRRRARHRVRGLHRQSLQQRRPNGNTRCWSPAVIRLKRRKLLTN